MLAACPCMIYLGSERSLINNEHTLGSLSPSKKGYSVVTYSMTGVEQQRAIGLPGPRWPSVGNTLSIVKPLPSQEEIQSLNSRVYEGMGKRSRRGDGGGRGNHGQNRGGCNGMSRSGVVVAYSRGDHHTPLSQRSAFCSFVIQAIPSASRSI